MSKEKKQSSYILESDEEPMRLEVQAKLDNVDAHLNRLPITNDAFVLDAGCGSGSMVRVMAKGAPNGRVFGVDRNLTHLSFAKRVSDEKEITNLAFISGDVFHLPFPDDTFDLLWSKYVMQHLLDDPVHAVAEFKRVTRPGGYVVLCDVDNVFLNNYPVEPELQQALEYFMLEVLPHDPLVGRKLHSLLHQVGLKDIQVDFEPSRIYTFSGRIDESIRVNIEVQIQAVMPKAIEAFGSAERANEFFQRFLDYIDREDSYSFTPLFFAQGRVP